MAKSLKEAQPARQASGVALAIDNRVSSRRFVWEGARDLRTGTLALQHRELEGSEPGGHFHWIPCVLFDSF